MPVNILECQVSEVANSDMCPRPTTKASEGTDGDAELRQWAAKEGANRVISDYHPSEGASKHGTQIPVIHRFYLFSALPSLG
jgi:hypothetical protein